MHPVGDGVFSHFAGEAYLHVGVFPPADEVVGRHRTDDLHVGCEVLRQQFRPADAADDEGPRFAPQPAKRLDAPLAHIQEEDMRFDDAFRRAVAFHIVVDDAEQPVLLPRLEDDREDRRFVHGAGFGEDLERVDERGVEEFGQKLKNLKL